MKAVPNQTRQSILESFDKGEGTRQEIADRYGVSLGMVKKLIQQRRKTGKIQSLHHRSGRKRKLNEEIRKKMKRWVEAEPWLTLKEIQERLEKRPISISCSIKTVHKELAEMGLRSKERTF